MSVLLPASFKEFRSLMCLWQALKLWKKQLEVRSLNVIWRRDLWGQEVNIFRQCLKVCHEKLCKISGTKRPEQPTKINEIDYRGKTTPALMTADVLLPPPAPLHPRPPPQPSLIPFLSWYSIASRCCYGVDVRLPGHREHIRRDSLKPVTYRSGRVTLVHLNARSSESWRGTTNFIFFVW